MCLLQEAEVHSEIVSTIEQQFLGLRWDSIASRASWAVGAWKREWYVRNSENHRHTHTCLVGWAELSSPWTHMQFFWTKRNCTMTNAINVSHPIGRRCWQRLRTFFSQLYTHWICLPFHSITWTFHEYSNGNGSTNRTQFIENRHLCQSKYYNRND